MEYIMIQSNIHRLSNLTLTREQLEELDRYKNVLKIIFLTAPFLLLAFGVPGNILTIMVLRTRAMKDNVFSYYLISMCSFNLLTLLVNLPRYINKGLTDNEITVGNKNFCAFYRYCSQTLVSISDWHLVVITGARLFYLVDKNKKYFQFYSSSFSTIFTLCLVMILFEVPAIGFWIRFKDEAGHEVECYLPGNSPLVHLQLSVQTLIPAVLLICLNVLILRMHNVSESGLMETEITSKLRKQLLLLVFLSNFQFMVSVFPLTIVYPNMALLFDLSTPLGEAKANLTMGIVGLLLYSTYATDFLIYCFFGRKFRKELFKLLSRLCGNLFLHKMMLSDRRGTNIEAKKSRNARSHSTGILNKKSITANTLKNASLGQAAKQIITSLPASISSLEGQSFQSPVIMRSVFWNGKLPIKGLKSGETLY